MRSLLMAQVVLAIFAGWCAGKILNELRESGKKLIIFLLLTFLFFSLVLSLSGLGYEFYGRWKERKVLRWEESQLLLWIEKTKYGEKTAFFEANEAYTAAELIPVISGRVTNTLGTFGGWVYLTNKDAQIRENYSVSTISSYLERSIDFDLDDFLKKTGNWLAYVKPDYLIMRNKLWVEEDINPFLIIFKQLFPETSFEVGNYTVFLYPKMDKEKFYKVKESITPILKEEVIPGKESFFLPLGFYLVKICGQNHSGTFTHLDLKIERYFSLLYTNLQDNEEKCYQRLFWSPKDNQYVFVLQSSPKIPLQIEIEKLNLPSL
ncbi:MAG: hypothetical protein M1514_03540 [Patescibacteria group bacterium]|nr:hypothetical protein [Patescibacteria group bacterium]